MTGMDLQTLLRNIEVKKTLGAADINVTGINIDSRLVKSGDLFVAVRGTQADGHQFIPKAMESGAKVIVCETLPDVLPDNVTFVQVGNTEDAVGKIATACYGNPT